MEIQDVQQIVHISSNITRTCPVCRNRMLGADRWEDSVNHVLGHGWKLLHVGGERDEDSSGKTIHHTVAVLGRV